MDGHSSCGKSALRCRPRLRARFPPDEKPEMAMRVESSISATPGCFAVLYETRVEG